MALLGNLDLRLDPWQTDYGTEVSLDGSPNDVAVTDLTVEVPGELWKPLVPTSEAALPARIVFIDGVRRIEARALARSGEKLVHGAFGSFAVGCSVIEGGRARWGTERIERVLALSGGASVPGVLHVHPGACYRPVSTAAEDADAPLRRLQDEMRDSESRVGREWSSAEDTLVVADGPL